MGNLFNMDNAFFRFMGKLFDVVALSLVYVIVCIPLITIGPATSALYYASVKSIRRDRSYPIKEFFHSFKRDFRQSFIMELILIIVGIILYVDIKFIGGYVEGLLENVRYVYLVIGLVLLFISIYAFPIISRFSLKLTGILKLSFYLSIRHILTTAVSVILILGAALAVYITAGLALLIIPVVASLLISLLMERVLKKCMKFIGGTETPENVDDWYME